LIIATGFYAAVAEVMTRSITPALKLTGISEQFAGLTIIGVLGNTAEFINAIQFALQNNITLRYAFFQFFNRCSMEIGMVSAIQIALLQIPVLVGLSAAIFQNNPDKTFTLIFPQLDLFAIIFAVIILVTLITSFSHTMIELYHNRWKHKLLYWSKFSNRILALRCCIFLHILVINYVKVYSISRSR
jgi:calcium/proton exchanger cax